MKYINKYICSKQQVLGVGNSNSLGVDSLAVVGDLSNVAFGIVGPVVDVLDAAVGQVDRVVALPGSGAVVSLGSVKAGSRVVVSHGVLVGVRGNLVGVDLSNSMGNGVSNSMTNDAMADTYTVTNANPMANAHSVANANTMANSSKQLGSGRGSSQEGGERKEGLRMKSSKNCPLQCQ